MQLKTKLISLYMKFPAILEPYSAKKALEGALSSGSCLLGMNTAVTGLAPSLALAVFCVRHKQPAWCPCAPTSFLLAVVSIPGHVGQLGREPATVSLRAAGLRHLEKAKSQQTQRGTS